MKDESKSKTKLISELQTLRKRVSQLEASETELKKAEAALEESEEKWRSLVENAPNVILTIASDGTILFINHTFSGVSTGLIIGNPVYNFVPPEYHDTIRNALERVFQNGESENYEVIGVTLDGVAFSTENWIGPIWHGEQVVAAILLSADMTERKRAEEALLEREQNFRDLVESLLDGVAIADENALHLYVNPNFSEITGYSKDELLNMTGWDLTRPEDRTQLQQRMKDRLAGKPHKKHYERVIIRKDGTEVSTEMSTTTTTWQGKKRPMAILRDITERKRAEDALRESEERYRVLAESADDYIYLIGLDLRVEYVNEAGAQVLIRGVDEILGHTLGEVFPPETAEHQRVALLRTIETGEVIVDDDIHKFPNGYLWLSTKLAPVRNKEGGVVGVLGISRDITERKRVEEALRESERRYRLLADNIADIIWTTDLELRPTYASPSVASMLGYSLEEALQMTPDKIVSKDSAETLANFMQERMSSKSLGSLELDDPATLEIKMIRKDGSEIWTENRIGFLQDESRNPIGVLGILRDITERKRMEGEIHTYQEQLKSVAMQLALTEEKERRRISIALHDNVGQILAMVKMKLGVMKAKAASLDLIKSCEEAYSLCEHAIKSTRDLTSEISPPILYELGLEAALEWLVEKHGEQHNLRVEFDTDGQDRHINDDIRGFVFQSVRELLVNTTNHAQAGGARVSIRSEGPAMRICVEDNGVGIDASELPASDGFGLFNIRERLSSIGGRLEIESKPGIGTRVTMLVPLEGSDDSPAR